MAIKNQERLLEFSARTVIFVLALAYIVPNILG